MRRSLFTVVLMCWICSWCQGEERQAAPKAPPSDAKAPSQAVEKPPLAVLPFGAAQAKKHQEQWAKYLGLPVELTNSSGMKEALIPAGEFLMGSPEGEAKWEDDTSRHRVRITKPFDLDVHEVNVQHFREFVDATSYKTEAEKDGKGGYGWNAEEGKFEAGKPKYTWKNTGWPQTDEHPVVNVTWNDAVAFCE